jgi:hypothetical protein
MSLPFDPDWRCSLNRELEHPLLLRKVLSRMPTGSVKGSALLVYLDTESNQTLNLFVMKERTLVAVGHLTMERSTVDCVSQCTLYRQQEDPGQRNRGPLLTTQRTIVNKKDSAFTLLIVKKGIAFAVPLILNRPEEKRKKMKTWNGSCTPARFNPMSFSSLWLENHSPANHQVQGLSISTG